MNTSTKKTSKTKKNLGQTQTTPNPFSHWIRLFFLLLLISLGTNLYAQQSQVPSDTLDILLNKLLEKAEAALSKEKRTTAFHLAEWVLMVDSTHSKAKTVLHNAQYSTQQTEDTLAQKIEWTATFRLATKYNRFVAAAFSPDGKILATSSEDDIIRLWHTETGVAFQLFRGWTGKTTRVAALAFSPDGKTLMSVERDKMLRVWDLESKHLIQSFQLPGKELDLALFSPNGKYLISLVKEEEYDQVLQLWEVKTGKYIRPLAKNYPSVNAVTFSPDGKILATVLDNRTIGLWELATGQQLPHFKNKVESKITKLDFSPNGKILATCSEDRQIRLWEMATGKLLKSFQPPNGTAYTVKFSPDGKFLALASTQGLYIYNVDTADLLYFLEGGPFFQVRFSNHGQVLAYGTTSKIHLWDMKTTAFAPSTKNSRAKHQGMEGIESEDLLASDIAALFLMDTLLVDKLLTRYEPNMWRQYALFFQNRGNNDPEHYQFWHQKALFFLDTLIQTTKSEVYALDLSDFHFQYGKLLLQDRQYKAALKHFRLSKGLASSTKHRSLKKELAHAQLFNGHIDLALEQYMQNKKARFSILRDLLSFFKQGMVCSDEKDRNCLPYKQLEKIVVFLTFNGKDRRNLAKFEMQPWSTAQLQGELEKLPVSLQSTYREEAFLYDLKQNHFRSSKEQETSAITIDQQNYDQVLHNFFEKGEAQQQLAVAQYYFNHKAEEKALKWYQQIDFKALGERDVRNLLQLLGKEKAETTIQSFFPIASAEQQTPMLNYLIEQKNWQIFNELTEMEFNKSPTKTTFRNWALSFLYANNQEDLQLLLDTTSQDLFAAHFYKERLAYLYKKESPEKQIEFLEKVTQKYERILQEAPMSVSYMRQYNGLLGELLKLKKDKAAMYDKMMQLCEQWLPLEDKKNVHQMIRKLNNWGYEALLAGNFALAEKIIRFGIGMDSPCDCLYTNLAPALLLQGQYQAATQEYIKWKNQPYTENSRHNTFKTVFLEDIRFFERKGIIPKKHQEAVQRVKQLLEE